MQLFQVWDRNSLKQHPLLKKKQNKKKPKKTNLPPAKKKTPPISRVSEVIIHRCLWVKYDTNCYRAWITSSVAFNSLLLHVGVPGIRSRQALCPHACVCPEPAALAVLFTQWLAPVLCFLQRGLARVTAAALPPLTLCFLLFMLPSPGYPLSPGSMSTRCDTSALLLDCSTLEWCHSRIKPCIFCVFAVPLGNMALGKTGFSTAMNSPWKRMPRGGWKIVFELKTKQRI